MVDSLLSKLDAGGLPAMLAAVLLVMIVAARELRRMRAAPPPAPPAPPPAPSRPSNIPDPPPSSRASWPRRRVLIVDDSPVQTHVLAALLRADLDGADVATTGSGEEALALVRAEAFDLLIVDVGMPGMSGAELVRRLRLSSQRPLVPVVLVSGLAGDALAMIGKDCGASACLEKPIDGAELATVAKRLLYGAELG